MGQSRYAEFRAIESVLAKTRSFSRAGHISPHKRVLILSIAEILRRELGHQNHFTFQEIEPVFQEVFTEIAPDISPERRLLEHPFYHLKSDGFWSIRLKPGTESLFRKYEKTRLTRNRLIETVDHACLSDDVFEALRTAIRSTKVDEKVEIEKKAPLMPSRAYAGDDTSLFSHEQSAIDQIRAAISTKSTGHVLSNVYIHDPQSNAYYECDVVIVARSGLYVVELKHWSGDILVQPNNWLIHGCDYRRDPHIANKFKCQLLRGLYDLRFPTYSRLWVESVVVLTNPEAQVRGADDPKDSAETARHNPTLRGIADLIAYLAARSGTPESQVLAATQVDAISEYLNSLARPVPTKTYTVSGYETVEYIEQRPECVQLIARPVDGRRRGLVRFRVFRVPATLTGEERNRAIAKAYNTGDAIGRIGTHANVQGVWVMANEGGDIIEGSEWSSAHGTLQDLILARQRSGSDGSAIRGFDRDEALGLCEGIARGLVAAHSAGVVHRALKPAHVIVANGVPKLTDFDLSHGGAERGATDLTVLPDGTALKDDGYVAPELLDGTGFDETTDLFGLAAIAYQLLAGVRPFALTRRLGAIGGKLGADQLRPLQAKGLPNDLVDAITGALVYDRAERHGTAAAFADICRRAMSPARAREESRPINAELKPGETYDTFEIVALIGKGAEAQIYSAKRAGGRRVALRVFNREVPSDRIYKESAILESLDSRNVVRTFGVHRWNDDRFFISQELIEGNARSLRDLIAQGERPDVRPHGSFWRVASGVLDALRALAKHDNADGEPAPLVHGDVKPDNILLTPSGEPKLSDFSLVADPGIGEFRGTVGYVPPDRIRGEDVEYDADSDLFALGVSLWEWLFGEKPFISPSVGEEAVPSTTASQLNSRLVDWLKRAVATRANERFATADEMLEALGPALSPLPVRHDAPSTNPPPTDTTAATPEDSPSGDHSARPGLADAFDDPRPVQPPLDALGDDRPTQLRLGVRADQSGSVSRPGPTAPVNMSAANSNPFVAYLGTLSNASAKNENATAEAQAHNPLFKRLRVANPLATRVRSLLLEDRKHVLLTGNAGDGKTTIADEIYRELTGQPLPNRPEITIAERSLVIIKDMSELPAEERVRVLQRAIDSSSPAHLIISNTGALIESARSVTLVDGPGAAKKDARAIQNDLLNALEADDVVLALDGHFHLLNAGRSDSIETALRVLDRIIEPDNWRECDNCHTAPRCPICRNARLLQTDHTLARRRIELLYRRMYAYGTRLTMRQMTGHLADALTSGLDCASVRALPDAVLDGGAFSYLFVNRLFGDDGAKAVDAAGQLVPVRHLRDSAFGVELDPAFEREAWSTENYQLPLAGEPLAIAKQLRPAPADSANDAAAARRQIRRLVFFFGWPDGPNNGETGTASRRFIATFLRSPELLDYVQLTRDIGPSDEFRQDDIRRRTLRVLQEYFAGVRLAEGDRDAPHRLYITLNRRQAGASVQVVLADFAYEDFQVIAKTANRGVKNGGRRLALTFRKDQVELGLDLPLLDYVARRHDGEMSTSISAFYADRLERFQAALLGSRTPEPSGDRRLNLLRLDERRRPRVVEMRIYPERIEVRD